MARSQPQANLLASLLTLSTFTITQPHHEDFIMIAFQIAALLACSSLFTVAYFTAIEGGSK
tara:strand:+ start:7 stop:189 length:183 start_codon:yes stop_codon:yes gene_type:complete